MNKKKDYVNDCNNYYFYKLRKKNNKSKLIKIWIICVLILSIFIIVLQILYNNDISGPNSYKENLIKEWNNYLNSKTSNYPPPLKNFMQ